MTIPQMLLIPQSPIHADRSLLTNVRKGWGGSCRAASDSSDLFSLTSMAYREPQMGGSWAFAHVHNIKILCSIRFRGQCFLFSSKIYWPLFVNFLAIWGAKQWRYDVVD